MSSLVLTPVLTAHRGLFVREFDLVCPSREKLGYGGDVQMPLSDVDGQADHVHVLCSDVPAVEQVEGEGGHHGGPLVAVDEGVVPDEGVHERSRLLVDRRVGVEASDRRLRAEDGRLQQTEVGERVAADLSLVEGDHVAHGQIAHYRSLSLSRATRYCSRTRVAIVSTASRRPLSARRSPIARRTTSLRLVPPAKATVRRASWTSAGSRPGMATCS